MTGEELPKNGVIYCATGKKLFLDEAIISVKSLRQYNKNISVSLFIDEKNYSKIELDLFNSVHIIKKPKYSFADKNYSMRNSPYQKTIYLDCDTIINGEISEIFLILKKFDLAAANVPFKNHNYKPTYYQAGVVAFKKNRKMEKFFNMWDKKFELSILYSDQPSFRNVITSSSISIFTLPPEYNFRISNASYIKNKIKIIHSHEIMFMDSLKRKALIGFLNKSSKERVWFPGRGFRMLKEEFNLQINFLLLFKEILFHKISKLLWNKFLNKNLKKKLRIKLTQFYLPWLINLVIPKEYKERLSFSYEMIRTFQKEV